jgi:hypothetical protein
MIIACGNAAEKDEIMSGTGGGGIQCKKCPFIGGDALELARHARKLHPKRKRRPKPEPVQLDPEVWLANEAVTLFESDTVDLEDEARVRIARFLVERYEARCA